MRFRENPTLCLIVGLAAPLAFSCASAPADPGSCCSTGGACRLVLDTASCLASELAIPNGICIPNICPQAGPSNDTCATATVLPGGAFGSYYGTTVGATSQLSHAGCVPDDPIDVWFRFTNTRPSEFTFNFNTEGTPDQNGNHGDTTLELFDACPTVGESLACDDNGAGNGRSRIYYTLAEGEGVRIRVAFHGGAAAGGAFRLNISGDVTPPGNDVCASATTITASPSTTLGDNSRATGADLTPCGANDQHDVWFTFTPFAGGQYVFDTLGSIGNIDTTLAVFLGCPIENVANLQPNWPANLLVCNDDIEAVGVAGTGEGEPRSRVKVNLIAGQSYKIRVSGYDNAEGDFRLNLSGPLPVLPLIPDTCDTAMQVNVPFSGSLYSGGARPDAPAGGCNSTAAILDGALDNAVWFTFVPATSGPLAGSIDGVSGDVRTDSLLLLLTGNCGGPYTQLACVDEPEPFDLGQLPALSAGTRYFLVVGDVGRFDGGGDYTININVSGGEALGACCSGTICMLTTAGVCSGPATHFVGANAACNVFGANNTTPCCLADFTKDQSGASISVQDIFDFLAAYFAGDPRANINGSTSGGVPTLSVQDIFDFLAAYFLGGC